ncbi:MAG: type II secretion system F family protein [Erysipelotrichaceae bacterium]|nr:type II secretion system F family protein [Erysipelotrichaceae bacterium]
MSVFLITAGFTIGAYCVFHVLFSNTEKERVKQKLNDLAVRSDINDLHDVVLNEIKQNQKKKRSSKFISKKFEDSLAMSGLQLNAREFMMLWFALSFGPIVIGSLLNVKMIAIIGMCIVGFCIPIVMVNSAKKKKQELFNKQLGEALTIMSNCLKTGYSFQQSLASIAQEMQPPISTEFSRVVKEVNYGTEMREALNNLVARTENKDLELLVSAVLTSMQVGANLSEILDTISGTVRDRIALREEINVLSSQGRFSGLIIGVLPAIVMVFLMITNPSYFDGFFSNPTGKILMIVSVIMEAVGFLVINKIIDIKY